MLSRPHPSLGPQERPCGSSLPRHRVGRGPAGPRLPCAGLTVGSGGNKALDRRYRLRRLNWMLVLVTRSSWMLVELSCGQMSLSPEKGDTVMVFLSS